VTATWSWPRRGTACDGILQGDSTEDLISDPRFKDVPIRTKNHRELEKEVTEALKGKTTAEWVDLMVRADIPCGPVNRVDELARDPHTAAREMITEVRHSKAGPSKW